MNEFVSYNPRSNGRNRLRSNKRNRKKVASVHRGRKDITEVYQKAVEEYEEYKKYYKNNIQSSVNESSEPDKANLSIKGSKDEGRLKAVSGKALNQAGRSVLTYKKLVNNIKSPYINQAVVENLQKAYYPGKIRKSKKDKRKKKSSTPNMKFRKYNKDFIPVLKQYHNPETSEQYEIDQLRMKRELEEQQVLKKQKENIEKLKLLQGSNQN